jgi:hypothetical protein
MRGMMADHPSILSQAWTDILPPAPPPAMSWWLAWSGLVLLLLVVSVVFILWQQRPRQRALRVLSRCNRQLQTIPTDSRRIAHVVHRALLQGLNLNPATLINDTRARDRQWQTFYCRLQQCVFQATPPGVDELISLIQQGRYWLRHYPR